MELSKSKSMETKVSSSYFKQIQGSFRKFKFLHENSWKFNVFLKYFKENEVVKEATNSEFVNTFCSTINTDVMNERPLNELQSHL